MDSSATVFSDLTVPFRGNRNYVHGTDIFRLFENCLSQISIPHCENLELKFTAPVTTAFEIEFSPCKTESFLNSPVQMTITHGESRGYLGIISNSNDCIRIDNRVEEQVAAQLVQADKVFSIQDQESCATIEKIVFINKAMLSELVDSPQDWFFGRLRLQDYSIHKAYRVGLGFDTLTGTGLASSRLYLDSKLAGDVIFVPK